MNKKGVLISAVTAITTILMCMPSSAYIKGDANGDGKLDIRDASHITRSISLGQSNSLNEQADYNGDGVINVRDAAAIAKHIATMIPQPIKEKATTAKPVTKVVVIKPTPSKPKHDIVYITKTGKKYHYSSTCNGGKYFPVKIEEALNKGLKPCNKCVL